MAPDDYEKLIINSDRSTGETLEIYYNDGNMVEGFVQGIRLDYRPAYVNLCKREVRKGENPNHLVEFDKIIKLVVKPYNSEPKVYE